MFAAWLLGLLVLADSYGPGSVPANLWNVQKRVLSGEVTLVTIMMGADWLKRHQDGEGEWSPDRFREHCRPPACDGLGEPSQRRRVSLLALLARVEAARAIGRGADGFGSFGSLLREQDRETGAFGAPIDRDGALLEHAIATLAVCEGGGGTQRLFARKAVEFIESVQRSDGRWSRTSEPSGDDVLLTGWMLAALRTATDADLQVDAKVLAFAKRWLATAVDPATSTSDVAVAIGVIGDALPGTDGVDAARMHLGVERLLRAAAAAPDAGAIDTTFWWFGSLAMVEVGGGDRKAWERRMVAVIREGQARVADGCARGSFAPALDRQGDVGGRVYSTAMRLLCAATPYRKSRAR